MKIKLIWFIFLLVLVLVGCILVGCSGNGVIPPPVDEPPIDLIREYTGRENVVRWPDGVVSVCDITGETKEIWNEINSIIDGPVIFELTDDTAAKIGISYWATDEFPFFCGAGIEDFRFLWYGFGIHPEVPPEAEDIYIQVCLTAAGIEKEKAAEGFTQEMEKVLYWLYRLEPGYPLK